MSKRTLKRHIKSEKESILKKFKGGEEDECATIINENNKKTNYDVCSTVCVTNNNIRNYDSDLVESGAEVEKNNTKGLQGKLIDWYHEFHPTRTCVNGILNILHSEHLKVPLSLGGLLKNNRGKAIIRTVPPGSYYHLGLRNQLEKLPDRLLNGIDIIYVDIGIDGLPLFKSSCTSLWPIMGKLSNIENVEVFLIGAYVGAKKPSSVDIYLHDFIYDLKSLKETGIYLDGRVLKVKIRAFICDTPARAFLCDVVGHNALNGCMKCYQVGTKINNVTVFSSKSSDLRTDEDFCNRKQKEFHKEMYGTSHSSLETFGVKMITQFPLDPMHLLDLGVTKKMLYYLTVINKKSNITMSDANKKILSNRLIAYSGYSPSEFQRKPRGIEELPRWKATEFRQFILYYGPIVLKNIIHDDVYYEFIILHVAYRLITTPKHFQSNMDNANELFKLFVENFSKIFGDTSITFNVHSTLHLTQCVSDYGLTTNFSAYCFENFLQYMKNRIRNPSKILQQIRNLFSKTPLNVKKKTLKFNKLRNGKIMSYQSNNFFLSTSTPNNFCCIKPYIPIIITGFSDDNEHLVKGIKIQNLRNFFEEPVPSSSIGIQVGDILTAQEESFEISNVYCKLAAFPIENSFVLLPLLHSCL